MLYCFLSNSKFLNFRKLNLKLAVFFFFFFLGRFFFLGFHDPFSVTRMTGTSSFNFFLYFRDTKFIIMLLQG